MSLHPSTFKYLKPTDQQIFTMEELRGGFANMAMMLSALLPDGPDKTYVLRSLRTCAMWANVAATRHADGEPRTLTDEITP